MNRGVRDMAVQSSQTKQDGKRISLKIHAPKAGVSWRINSYDGDGTRELEASTFLGGRWFEMTMAETFFPKDHDKRIVRKETRIDLTYDTATELRDMLNAYLSTEFAHAEARDEDFERDRAKRDAAEVERLVAAAL